MDGGSVRHVDLPGDGAADAPIRLPIVVEGVKPFRRRGQIASGRKDLDQLQWNSIIPVIRTISLGRTHFARIKRLMKLKLPGFYGEGQK